MSRIVFNPMTLAMVAIWLSGCGLTQTVADGTASTTKAIFHRQVTTLHLDLSAATTHDTDTAHRRALSLPTLVRVYQLRDSKALEQITYEGVLNEERPLSSALLDKRLVVVKPEHKSRLSVPMDKDTQAVAVVALFHRPDTQLNTWRLTLTRDELLADRARLVELGDNGLTLAPLAKE
ncbi:type VI secretion system lipoprotein TssJ [Pseudomonas sp. RGM2987]|uniref:type VI secretion system lipoprotein TssJ n=1 Tax=Pseudomonas sp. RGM2987 TaxID=2930090 RepID=UPI001FD6813D|nr:type VI secretion system lipoprotein TssJ [Pseudomonas sp. RGM2987]MCJ8207142.1 type VI secretion system lipoprotein TssJ [Pseudomonas sp. RGM2987]